VNWPRLRGNVEATVEAVEGRFDQAAGDDPVGLEPSGINHKLPQCPMCGEGIWERSTRSPFRQTLTGLTSRLN
jgi:hypothetical protein